MEQLFEHHPLAGRFNRLTPEQVVDAVLDRQSGVSVGVPFGLAHEVMLSRRDPGAAGVADHDHRVDAVAGHQLGHLGQGDQEQAATRGHPGGVRSRAAVLTASVCLWPSVHPRIQLSQAAQVAQHDLGRVDLQQEMVAGHRRVFLGHGDVAITIVTEALGAVSCLWAENTPASLNYLSQRVGDSNVRSGFPSFRHCGPVPVQKR